MIYIGRLLSLFFQARRAAALVVIEKTSLCHRFARIWGVSSAEEEEEEETDVAMIIVFVLHFDDQTLFSLIPELNCLLRD